MDFEDYEANTGWRPVFHHFPMNRSMAQHVVMPIGTFYSPFMTQVE